MCKEIFLDELPHKGKFVDWKNSVEYSVKGIYDDIEFEIEIIDYYRKNKKSYLKIKYNNNIYPISIVTLLKCKLGKILGMYTNEFKIEIGQTFKDDKRDLLIIDRKYKKIKQEYIGNGINTNVINADLMEENIIKMGNIKKNIGLKNLIY
jgi:hypothetical protein